MVEEGPFNKITTNNLQYTLREQYITLMNRQENCTVLVV